uniref:Uncharacterized protein n=1 Tax=Arundo donax TaxID=35708 RepID=A0A0A8Y0R6_ARUDO
MQRIRRIREVEGSFDGAMLWGIAETKNSDRNWPGQVCLSSFQILFH